MKKIISFITTIIVCANISAQTINIVTEKNANNRQQYAAEYLQKKLNALGYEAAISENVKKQKAEYHIFLQQSKKKGLAQEGFSIVAKKNATTVVGNDGTGVIYGCNELAEHAKQYGNLNFKSVNNEKPSMVLRGACIGMQKTVFLPGRYVYEYPYTPEDFPWFYDKEHWIEYLDMLVDNRMNSLYLWNGHPFASLVKLKDYPFAIEVDDATFKKNQDVFSFLTHEADKRGIFVIQMFYNILLSTTV